MGRLARFATAVLFAALALVAAPAARAGSVFSSWAAIVVAGDYHAAHANVETEAFDNARRDVSLALERAGFSATNLRQFSTHPDRYPDIRPLKSENHLIGDTLTELAAQATGGCLVYLTSHGGPGGIVIDTGYIAPAELSAMITQACGRRPTVVIISACFSGVFLDALNSPNRMVLTAARPDRSSFGCSESDKYPYFDTCFLQVLPTVQDFAALGPAVQACVAQREIERGMSPPSEPQLRIDPALRPNLPLYRFAPPG